MPAEAFNLDNSSVVCPQEFLLKAAAIGKTGTFAAVVQSIVVIAEGIWPLFHPFFSTHSTANLKVTDTCYLHKLFYRCQVKIARPTDLNITF